MPGRFQIRWTRATAVTLASIVLVALAFAWLAWKRRWISDDGLIFVRIVHQILDGNGPVYNAFERAEANTSMLWPWLLALLGLVTRAPIAQLSVVVGLVCSVAGLTLALDGTRRWHRARGRREALVPAGAIVPLALFPFWDYATSGLETGLTTLWLGTTWWLFATLGRERRHVLTAIVFGLGPLVRPDLGLVSIVFLVAGWRIVRPPRRRTFALLAAAFALPLVYEIFRAGYYGTLVPLPALAKGAGHADWGRGYAYLRDFVDPSWLWIPALLFAGLAAFAVARRKLPAADRVVVVAPLASGFMLAVYVMRVGGDFMHARMWLPAAFIALAPGLLLPWRRWTAPVIIAVALWGGVIEHVQSQSRVRHTGTLIEDERIGYTWWTHDRNPISEAAYVRAMGEVGDLVYATRREHRRAIVTEGGGRFALGSDGPESFVFIAGRLGAGGALTPVGDITADTLGLANPLGARITVTNPEEAAGHQKSLPLAWVFGDLGDPAHDEDAPVPPVEIRAARHALHCGDIRELLESAREPMSVGRFFANLTGAVHRTRLVIPANPLDAETRFCGPQPRVRVTSSTSCEKWGWGAENAVDGWTRSHPDALGYSSQVWVKQDHSEWIALELPQAQPVRGVTLYPRSDEGFLGMGFPIDFQIQTWNGSAWVDAVTQTGFPPPDAPRTFTFAPVTTSKIRIVGTKLQNVPKDDYVMQFAEILLL